MTPAAAPPADPPLDPFVVLPDDPPAAVPPRARRPAWRRVVGAVAAAIVAVALVPLAALLTLTHVEAPLHRLLTAVPGLAIDGWQGRLADGRITVDAMTWQAAPGAGQLRLRQVVIEQPQLQWRLDSTRPLRIGAARVSAASAEWTSGPAAAQRPPPPTHLRLFLALSIDELSVGRVQVDALPPLRDLSASVRLGADAGRQHRLPRLAFTLDHWRATGSATVATGGDMALSVQMQAAPLSVNATQDTPAVAARQWSQATGQLQATGPLAGIEVQAQIQRSADAAAPALQAQARIEPFKPWPVPMLKLQTRGLDLQLLAAGWPRSLIDADVDLQLAGWDRPAKGHIDLRNGRPGRWDSGALPVRRLQARLAAQPDQRQQLRIEQLEVDLADGTGATGRLTGQGHWTGRQAALDLRLSAAEPARWWAGAPPVVLDGSGRLSADGLPMLDGSASIAPGWSLTARLDLNGQLRGGKAPIAITASTDLSARADELTLRKLQAQVGEATLTGQLEARRSAAGWSLRTDGRVAALTPDRLWPGLAGSPWSQLQRLQGRWDVDAAPLAAAPGTPLWQRLVGKAEVLLDDSRVGGEPLQGQLKASRPAQGAWTLHGQLDWGGNATTVDARLVPDPPRSATTTAATTAADIRQHLAATVEASAQLRIHSPQRLAPLLRILALDEAWQPSAGQLDATLHAAGRWPQWTLRGDMQARGLASRRLVLRQATAQFEAGMTDDAPLRLALKAEGLDMGGQRLDRIDAQIDGRLGDHRIALTVDSPVRPPAWTETLLGATGTGTRLDARGQGRWQRDGTGARWSLSDIGLALRARAVAAPVDWLAGQGLAGSLHFDASGAPTQMRMEPGRVALPTTGLRWQDLHWQAAAGGRPSRLRLSATLDAIQVARVLDRLQPELGWSGDLRLGGRLAIDAAEHFSAELVLERESGDLDLQDDAVERKRLGLTELRLAFSAKDGQWQFAQGLAGSSIGAMAAAAVITTDPRARWPHATAPLQGVMELQVARLGAWGAWVPAGWRIGGRLLGSATLAGQLNAPQLQGRMSVQDFSLRNLVQGFHWVDGELQLALQGERATLERGSLRGGDGRLLLSGEAVLGAQPQARLSLQAERFQLLGRLDRRLVVSGSGDLRLWPQRVQVEGRFGVDRGLIDFSRADAPALDEDVVVRRPADAVAADAADVPVAQRWRSDVDLNIDLGSQLRVRGRGLDTGLRGSLRITTPANRLRLQGTVRTEGGTYQAYGQTMEIERGEMAFNGPPEAARLDVRAIRPHLDVRVGVAVTGTPQNPRVRLFSEPDLPEFDKLSWLVLGRGPDALGRADTALIQRAAVALLSGDGAGADDNLLARIGLTDFSVRQSDGESRETVVSLGRQLTRRWYVGYERSLNETLGTWQLVYRAAQRFTLRAQWGAESSMDAIWSWRWQ
ncbi:MAG: translocation/assembly module TamB domain-containing protein [Aquabacterium sp.]